MTGRKAFGEKVQSLLLGRRRGSEGAFPPSRLCLAAEKSSSRAADGEEEEEAAGAPPPAFSWWSSSSPKTSRSAETWSKETR